MIVEKWLLATLAVCLTVSSSLADPGDKDGPYSYWYGDIRPGILDSGIPGFVGPDGEGKAGDDNYVNPVFVGWASNVENYTPAPGVGSNWSAPEKALGQVMGFHFDVVSLGDLDQDQIDAWQTDPGHTDGPGEITLAFEFPVVNGSGADFAVFENGFERNAAAVLLLFAELGFVEVSTDGTHFARFPSTFGAAAAPVGAYGPIDTTYVHNFAGKHLNAYGDSWGTPFDLQHLEEDQNVKDGLVDLSEINYIRIVDIPGSGDFLDTDGGPIFDGWVTTDSGGVDLEAIGAIHQDISDSPPIVSTLPKSLVTSSSATLKGMVNPGASSATTYFEYGTTTDYGFRTDDRDAGSGNKNILTAEEIGGLTESTVHHFRIVASNAFGTSKGGDRQFVTPAGEKDDQAQNTNQGQLPDTGECFIGSVVGVGRYLR
jgi:hypothetical protein